MHLEADAHTQHGHRLVEILHQLETLLGKKVQHLINRVLGADTDIGAETVMLLVPFAVGIAALNLVTVVGEAHQGVDVETALGDDVVDIDVGIVGCPVVVPEENDELGGDAQLVEGIELGLQAEIYQKAIENLLA